MQEDKNEQKIRETQQEAELQNHIEGETTQGGNYSQWLLEWKSILSGFGTSSQMRNSHILRECLEFECLIVLKLRSKLCFIMSRAVRKMSLGVREYE